MMAVRRVVVLLYVALASVVLLVVLHYRTAYVRRAPNSSTGVSATWRTHYSSEWIRISAASTEALTDVDSESVAVLDRGDEKIQLPAFSEATRPPMALTDVDSESVAVLDRGDEKIQLPAFSEATSPPMALTDVDSESVAVLDRGDEKIQLSAFSEATSPPMALPQHTTLDVSTGKDNSSLSMRPDFSFPHPQVYLPTQTILRQSWVQELRGYLLSIHPARSLTITVATEKFIPNLLNWLVAAHLLVDPPLQHILVVAFDKKVHTIMKERKLPCVYVPFSSVMKSTRNGVSRVWMTRLAVIRLLNHWGYDVQQFDNDAVLLRNPELLFGAYSDCDLAGARGILPFELGRGPWGFTLCMGAARLRATEKMEGLWEFMHNRKMDKTVDDQKRINFAMQKTGLLWNSKERLYDRANIGKNRNGLMVAVLPPKYICRKTCHLNTTTDLFIWHQSGGGHSASWKSKQNTKSHMWFLRSDFMTRVASPDVTGTQWLEWITLPGSVDHVRQILSHSRPHEHL